MSSNEPRKIFTINNSKKEISNKYQNSEKLRIIYALIERRLANGGGEEGERDGKDAEFNPLTRVSDDRAR